MTISISTSAPYRSGDPRPRAPHSHWVSALRLFILVTLTGLVTGLIVAITFVGVLDQLMTASH
jgi:hypothetical protein